MNFWKGIRMMYEREEGEIIIEKILHLDGREKHECKKLLSMSANLGLYMCVLFKIKEFRPNSVIVRALRLGGTSPRFRNIVLGSDTISIQI